MKSPLTSTVKRALNAASGQVRYNIDTHQMEAYNGTHWQAVSDTFEYKLETSSGTVYGSKYYIAEPINAGNKWDDMMTWMVSTFGPSADDGVWTPDMRWYANNAKFWFKNKKDLDWFVLRWSS